MMFLRILDEKEQEEELKCQAVGKPFTPSLKEPYRWRDFLAESYAYFTNPELSGRELNATEIEHLKHDAFWGLDNSDTALDYPHIGLKNTLSGRDTYMELFEGARSKFDYIPQKAIGSILQLSNIRRISFTTPPDRCAAPVEQAKALHSDFLGAPGGEDLDRINRMDRIDTAAIL